MTTAPANGNLAILRQGAPLRAAAIKRLSDPNEAYLFVHHVMARAFDAEGRAVSPAALDHLMRDEIARCASAGSIGHTVMP